MHSMGQLTRLAVLLLLCCSAAASGDDRTPKEGFLAVTVTLGADRIPLTDASVSVRGYRHVYMGDLSAVLSQTKDGVFGASLPPGVYDVFISHAAAYPVCMRVAIVAGEREVFYANLKFDMEHMEK